MKSNIKALPTRYNGILFRSRIEARWAIFFSSLGITYQYEPEGYETSFGNYLPDFLLPKQDSFPTPMWVEIKGIVRKSEWEKLSEVVEGTQIRGTILTAMPTDRSYEDTEDHSILFPVDAWEIEEFSGESGVGHDDCHKFCDCSICGAIGFEYRGRAERIACGCGVIKDLHKDYRALSPVISKAFQTAMAYRFGT